MKSVTKSGISAEFSCLVKSKSSVNSFRRYLALGVSLLWSFGLSAQPLDPVEELIFFGQNDHLIIDRGGPVDGVGDVNGDGLDDVVVGSGIGAVRVIFGPTNGNNGIVNGASINGVVGFGISHDNENLSYVSGVGDVNADGFDDILVGSLGGTHVVFGKAGAFSRTVDVSTLNGSNGFSFDSPASSVSGAGDVNGDGIVDIIIGNTNASANGLTGVGVSYVIYGSRSGFPTRLQPDALNGNNGFAVVGTNSDDRSGKFVGEAGDFNHDGIDDFMIGASYKTQNAVAEVGEAYLIYGRREGFPAAISLSDINGRNGFVFKGSNIQDSAGAAVTGIGDLNHDGIDDIAIGAPGKGPFGSPSDYPGEVYVLFGGNFIGVAELNEQSLNGSNGFVARGIRGGVVPIEEDQAIWGDLAGTSLDGAGDFNNDGIDDLLIGASHTIINPRRKGVGQIYVIYGTTAAFPARFNLADLDGDNGFRINGIGTVDYFGVYSRAAGDFNADGRDDIIIGASGQGNSYVIYGRDPWAAVQPPAANVPFNGSENDGFVPTAFNLETDAAPLFFRELDDPTGPTPLPTGTSTTLGDPATPGDVAAVIVAPVEPLRPSAEPEAVESEVDPAVEPPDTAEPTDETQTTPETNDQSPGANQPTTDTNNANEVASNPELNANDTVSVGAASWWLVIMLLLLPMRRRLAW